MVVLTPRDAVADEEREERCREVFQEKFLDDVVAANLDIDEMANLFPVGLEQLIEGFELRRVSGLETDRLARPRVDAVMEGDLKDLGQVGNTPSSLTQYRLYSFQKMPIRLFHCWSEN
jgi:hypothetical protein